MLEKNRDNLAKTLPGAAKYQLTQGEIVANGAYYNALRARTSCPAQILQPFLDYAFGFRRGVNAGQPPDNAGPRAELPFPSTAFPARRPPDDEPGEPDRKRLVTVAAVALAIALVAGAAFLVRQVFFGPNTITAYFPTATAIYPGDEVRVSGVKVGTIDSIDARGHAGEDDPQGRPRRAGSGRRQGRHRRAEPGRGPLRPARRRRTGAATDRPWPTVR